MGLIWAVVALCALQALAALAVLPTAELSRDPSKGESISNLQDDISRYLETTDDSLKGQVAALQETLEDVAECWGQRRRRRRRRPRPPPPPPDGDGGSEGTDNGGTESRRRRQAPSSRGQMHFSGSDNAPAPGHGSMSFDGSAGTDVIGQTLGSIPKMIGQGINAATGMFRGNASGRETAEGGLLHFGGAKPSGMGGQNRPIKGSNEPSAGTGSLGKLPGMATEIFGGGGGSNSGSGGISSWWSGGNNRNPGMGGHDRPGGGPNMQGPGTGFLGKPPGMATQMFGGGGGSNSGSGGISSWWSGGNNRNPGMGDHNGPDVGSNMQGQSTGFLGKTPGIASQVFGGRGGSNTGSGGNNRNPGMGHHSGANVGGPGRPGVGGEGGFGASYLEKIPGVGGMFSGMGGRGRHLSEGESGGRPFMSPPGTTQGMGEGNAGFGMGGGPQGPGRHPEMQVHGRGHSHGHGNYQGGEAAVNFPGNVRLGGRASRPMGESTRGAGDMEHKRTMPPPKMGGHSRRAGDMVPRGTMPPASVGTGGSAEATAGEQADFSRPGNRSHNWAAGSQGNMGSRRHDLHGSNGKRSGSFEDGCTTESQEGRRGSDRSRKHDGCNSRSKRAVLGVSSPTSRAVKRQGRGSRREGSGGGRSRTRSPERSSRRNGSSGRGIVRRRTDRTETTGRRATDLSSSSSSVPNVSGQGKRTYSFSSSSMSSDGRGTFQSGGGVVGRAPSVHTVRKTRAKRQIDVGSAVTAAGLAAQLSLTLATQVLGLVKQGIGVAALAANTAIDVAERVRPPPPKRRLIIRIYQPRRRG